MTRDDIIKLALDAGFCHDINNGIYLCALMHIERFATLVAAAEREACAKVADAHDFYGVAIANDIRARGQE